jgi:GNAT superfamily N-acetyltransferase
MSHPAFEKLVQSGFTVRPPTMEDVTIVTELHNICSFDLVGREQSEPSDFVMSWEAPDFDKEASIRLLFTNDDQLVGYGFVSDHSEPYVRLGVGVRVHPEFRGKSIGKAVLTWAEARIRPTIKKAPEGTQVIMSSGCNQKDEYSKKLFEDYGMEIIRHFFQMEIEFDGPPAKPVIPQGIIIRPYNIETEIEAMGVAYLDSFRDHFGFTEMPIDKLVEYIQHMIAKDPYYDPELWMLAIDGDEIAGLVICSPKTTEDPEMGFVGILGVRRPWRKRGLGLALLQHAFGELYQRGSKRVGLGVDASSLTGATRLYEKAGMKVTRQYDTYQKILREGDDISTTSL